ncbi:TPR (repeat) domain protein [Legionella beliardensis]|uniref:TPR (Repeat) domain protein n=1 Tax=Legionella beliardensis TaxID=91822 RepID=A0A378I569_9GAMM|nr:VWA domain-containing protein [Legionella beliardensis]STX30163.1 TPR (repeat) domain protein [Legionella beliardensis]
MIADFHFLRPWWLVSLLPLLLLGWQLARQNSRLQAWSAVCDSHLLAHLIKSNGTSKRRSSILLLLIIGILLIISLAGPSWSRLPVPAFQAIQPRVIVLDMSEDMLDNDLTPDRLTRAKFKLHDLFTQAETGQLGLIVFTSEPFVVSPLTEDAKTIDALLSSLTPEIMPIGGQQLSSALEESAQLIRQAGFNEGQLLLLTASPPNADSVSVAKKLATQGIATSVMPMVADQALMPLFKPLATAGQGTVLSITDTPTELAQWLRTTNKKQQFTQSEYKNIPVWRDEGRWFLLPALFLLLPLFRRGWLQRIDS